MSRTAPSLLRNLAKEFGPLSLPIEQDLPVQNRQNRTGMRLSGNTRPAKPFPLPMTSPQKASLVEDVRRQPNEIRHGSCDRAVKKAGGCMKVVVHFFPFQSEKNSSYSRRYMRSRSICRWRNSGRGKHDPRHMNAMAPNWLSLHELLLLLSLLMSCSCYEVQK